MNQSNWYIDNSEKKEDPIFEEAVYTEREHLWMYWCNPLLEALPVMPSVVSSYKRLAVPLKQNDSQRRLPARARAALAALIYKLHIPTSKDIEIYMQVEQQLMSRYDACNPIPLEKRLSYLRDVKKLKVTEDMRRQLTAYQAPPLGFPVIGLSGTGKTCSVMNVFTLYPQLIRHTQYHGEQFSEIQIVWLQVNCPGDGTPKGLCIAIIEAIDEVLKTDYEHEYVRYRVSKDVLITQVRRLLLTFHVGIIAIDDIQNLCSAKNSATHELQSFLVYLTNQLAIPIIRIGTPKFLELVQGEFQLGKRTTGAGEVNMDLYKNKSYEWDNFIGSIWHCQYTAKAVELTNEMSEAFYNESVGNVFIASLLYKLVQDNAMLTGKEYFTVSDVINVSRNKIGITAAKRQDMLNGIDLELKEYKKLWKCIEFPKGEHPGQNNTQPEQAGTRTSEELSLDVAIASEHILQENYSLTLEDARKYTRQEIIANPNLTEAHICAGRAYARYMLEHSNTGAGTKGAGMSGASSAQRDPESPNEETPNEEKTSVLKGATNYEDAKKKKLIKDRKA